MSKVGFSLNSDFCVFQAIIERWEFYVLVTEACSCSKASFTNSILLGQGLSGC